MITMNEIDLANKRVLIREDLNVPIKDGIITSDQRLQAALPTILKALEANAAVIIMSHLGRPAEGLPVVADNGSSQAKYSLKLVADYLQENLNVPVRFEKDYLEGIDINPGEVVVCENVRFNKGEKDNDQELAEKYAKLCDVFVMDAFGTAHRKHASTYGVIKYAKEAVAGPLLAKELANLEKILHEPATPVIAVVGGAKVSSKLSLLRQIVKKVDYLIPGGGIANTFLMAQGSAIGNSLCESELLDDAREILKLAEDNNCKITLPIDVVVGKEMRKKTPAFNKLLKNVAVDDMILDIGPETITKYLEIIAKAKTIIWNGPIGVFELPQFAYGTRSLAIAIAQSEGFTIAGGGDTLAAIDLYNLNQQISYISTGGGAFLSYLEGMTLPAVAALCERA